MACSECGGPNHNKRTHQRLRREGADDLSAVLLDIISAEVVEGVSADPAVTPKPDDVAPITEPGVYALTAEQYHSYDITGQWISNSDGRKLLATCPAQFDYDRRNGVRKTSDAFDFGHVAHTLVLGQGEQYSVFEPKKLDGRTKEGKAQKQAVDEARAAGCTPIYGDDWAKIQAMVEAIESDPKNAAAKGFLKQPGKAEQCLFWREEITVDDEVMIVQRRAMLDHLPDMPPPGSGRLVQVVDYKTADDVTPDEDLRRKIYDYGYHRQADTYRSAIQALFNRDAEVVFVLQSKKAPHLCAAVDLDTPAYMVGAIENGRALEIWARCQATGVWPGYEGVTTLGVPAWIERQFEDQMVIS